MKKTLLLLTGMTAAGLLWAADEAAAIKSDQEKMSYALGQKLADNLKRQMVDLSLPAFYQGVKDIFAGQKSRLTTEEATLALQNLQKDVQAKQEKILLSMKEKNLTTSKNFLAENAKKKGVTTLPSGLQFEVLKEGQGAMPKATDTVVTHYKGTLIDGREFDNSYQRGQPAKFPVNGVIPGWSEALQKMKVGSKWRLVVPPQLAYGEEGAGAAIEPNSALIFEIDLISIETPAAKTQQPSASAPATKNHTH